MTVKDATNVSHRDAAVSFLKLASSGRIDEAYERHVAPHFKHHNQYFRGDRASLMAAMKENAGKFPGTQLTVKLVVGEANMVTVYSHVIMVAKELEVAVVHIMRFQEGSIVELWDLGQVLSKESPNENGMF